MKTSKNFINGKWVHGKKKKYYYIKNFNGEKVSKYPDSDKIDLDSAIKSTALVFEKNSFFKSKNQRLKVLNEIYFKLKKNIKSIINAEVSETGKIYEDASKEIHSGIELWKSAIQVLKKTNFRKKTNIKKQILISALEPIGLVGLIIPWNYPFIVSCERLPFIIAAGCPVILKPSEYASASVSMIIKIISKTSAPKQLISLVHGKGKKIGKLLVSDNKINMISFTGSTNVAKDIIKNSSSSIKKLSLELGGKNPMILTSDANLEKSLKYITENFLENAGQACIAGSILFIESKIYNKTKKRLINKLKKIRSFQKPITKLHNQNIKNFISSSIKKGAKIVYGDKKSLKSNKAVEPFILEGVNRNEKLFLEEIFGTVLILKSFKSFKNILNELNKNKYGLAVYLYSKNKTKIKYFEENVRFGRVWVNCSLKSWHTNLTIGGFRNSGYGSETSSEGLKNYLVNKSIISMKS